MVRWILVFVLAGWLGGGCQEQRMEHHADDAAPIADQGPAYVVRPIGKVAMRDGRTFIEIEPRYEAGLRGLERHSYVDVVWWFDKNDTPRGRSVLEVHPRGDRTLPLTGVFATHSPFRPNLIGITRCDIVGIEGAVIEVREIDAFDGTPVLDLKGDFFRFYQKPE